MSTAVAEPQHAVTGVWFAARAGDAGYRSHQLARTWEARKGGARPSLCGEWRRVWIELSQWANPDAFTECPDCARLAAAVPVPDDTSTAGREVDPRRVVPAAAGAPPMWHLLHTVPRTRSVLTLAVCGEPRLKWRTAPAGAPLRPCPLCVAQLPAAPPKPVVQIAPTARSAPTRYGAPTAAPARAVVLDPQLAAAALPAGWRPRRALRLPVERDDDGNRQWRAVHADDHVPAALALREAQHLENRDRIAFPPWVPLTYCATPSNGKRADATPASTR